MGRIFVVGRRFAAIAQQRCKGDLRQRGMNSVQRARMSADIGDILRVSAIDGRHAEEISDLGIIFMEVSLSQDYQVANVEWACPPGKEIAASTFVARKTGFFRSSIAAVLQGKRTPKLIFKQKEKMT